jgi:hypothetical protein
LCRDQFVQTRPEQGRTSKTQSTESAFFTPYFVRGKLNLSYAEKLSPINYE